MVPSLRYPKHCPDFIGQRQQAQQQAQSQVQQQWHQQQQQQLQQQQGWPAGGYGYGYMWNVPQWYPHTSMALFAPAAGFHPMQYAGQLGPHPHQNQQACAHNKNRSPAVSGKVMCVEVP